MSGGGSSRRHILGYGVAVAAAIGGVAGLNDARRRADSHAGRHPVPRQPELPQPRLLRSEGRELSVRLTARPAVVGIGAARPVTTVTYDGVLPGHTWEVRPGDTLRVHLRNRLPALRERHPRTDRPHQWTTTNLQAHGLHVSPADDSAFLAVPPGADHRLEIKVPAGHPGGLFWYHPHRHGGMAQELRGGMAGALVVRGEIDLVDEVRAAAEKIMVLQAIELGPGYALTPPDPGPRRGAAFFPAARVLYPVNGALAPRVTMYPGEVQRWRLVNASAGTFMSLRLQRHALHVLAWDGLTLPAAERHEVVMLAPGNRVDLLVRAGQPGRYHLALTPGTSEHPDIPGMPTPGPGSHADRRARPTPGFPALPAALTRRALLTVEVAGHGPRMSLPGALPAYHPPALPVTRSRSLAFTMAAAAEGLPRMGIDGVPYDPERRPYRAVLGTAEEWTLRNGVEPGLGPHAQVFHAQVNPVRITRRNGRTLESPHWRDTCVLTQNPGDSITFETSFLDYPGRLVTQCQIAAHADLGMMSAVEVVHR